MNRIILLAEWAGMVIRLMQLWVPQRGCLLSTMGRNRGFWLKVGSCWQFLFLRYNSNLSLFFPWLCQKIFKGNIVIIRAAGHGGSP